MGELAAQVAVLVLLTESLRRLLGPLAWKRSSSPPKRRVSLWVHGFTLLTLPLVLLIYLAAALSLLPYVLLCKPYRMHLVEVRRRAQNERCGLELFPWQLASLDVTDFLSLPFRLVFAFMDQAEKRLQAPSLPSVAPSNPLKQPHGPSHPS